MKLSQINEAMNHRITSGSEYNWQCFPDARFLDYESDFAHVSVLYSTVDQTVYQAEVSVKREAWDEDKKPYRWLNPDYVDAFYKESKKRKVDTAIAWDDVTWIDLEMEEDFLEKATAIFNGEECDTRVQFPIDIDDELILKLSMEAHKRDITLNKMIEIILQEVIDNHRVNGTVV
jgi:purine-nucleoside phosphorylase